MRCVGNMGAMVQGCLTPLGRIPRFSLMRLALTCLALLAAGCAADPSAPAGSQNEMFAPKAVRIHPVFTKIASWSGDERPEGIEALVELRDQFDDTCKGAGSLVFELYEFRTDQPDPRGKRLYNPWQVDIDTEEEQRERWSKTGRCYTFRLAADRINENGRYVLTVSFTPTGGTRLFDRIVLGSGR